MSTAPPTLMSIRMENPATKFYHAVNNTIKILYNKKNLSSKFSEHLMNRKEEDRAQILFQIYELIKKKRSAMEEGIIEVFRDQGYEEIFKEVLTLKTLRSVLKSFAEDDLVGVIPEPFAFKKLHEIHGNTMRMDVYETALKQQKQLHDDESDQEVQDSDMLNQGMSVDEPQLQNKRRAAAMDIDFEKLMNQIEKEAEREDQEEGIISDFKEEPEIEAPEALFLSEHIVNMKLKYVNVEIEKELKDLKAVMSKNGLSLDDLGEDEANRHIMKAILKEEGDEGEEQTPPKKDMTFQLF